MALMNVNLENLTTKHGDKAADVFREIADLGGYGSIGNGEGQINPAYAGGLDIAGVLNPSNTAVSNKAKDRIAELAGVKRPEAPIATTSSDNKKQG